LATSFWHKYFQSAEGIPIFRILFAKYLRRLDEGACKKREHGEEKNENTFIRLDEGARKRGECGEEKNKNTFV